MLVNVSENNHSAWRKSFVVVGLCLLWLLPTSARAQDAAADYQREQAQKTQQLKRLNKSFLTPEIVQGFKKVEREYRGILRSGCRERDKKKMEILRLGLQFRIFTLSDSDIQRDPRKFATANKTLDRELTTAANQAQIPNANDRRNFRELVYTEAMPLLKRLVKEGDLKARGAALQRMVNLEIDPGRGQSRLIMFDGVDDAYLEVLNDPEQPDSVKTFAASFIKTYLEKADAVSNIEVNLADAILKELARPPLGVGYQITLMQALEQVRAPRQLAGTKAPVIYCAMATMMTNRALDIQVRCRAARVMGRVGWDRSLDFDVLAWATADLTAETAFLFNQAPDKDNDKWAYCGWYLYTAFHHVDGKEASGKPSEFPKGFLNRAPSSKPVREAYTASVDVMARLIMNGGNGIPVPKVAPVFRWVAGNKPANMKFDAACPPFTPAAAPGK